MVFSTSLRILPQEPWFLELNPNGRIPVVVDHQRDDHVVFETSAIMLYIAQHYDTDFHFWFDPAKDANSYSDMLQWIFFTVCASSVGHH